MQLLLKKKGPKVYIEVLMHDVSVADYDAHDVLIRCPIEKIDYYRQAEAFVFVL